LRHEERTVNSTRRHLLLGATAAVCAGAAGTAWWELHDDDDDPGDDLVRAATELLGDADGTPWLGQAYLRAHPGITKTQVARRMLGRRRKRPSTADELRRVVRRDYAAGRTVVVEDWYFAEAEAAAAALLVLDA
jgi:hypothetical protein